MEFTILQNWVEMAKVVVANLMQLSLIIILWHSGRNSIKVAAATLASAHCQKYVFPIRFLSAMTLPLALLKSADFENVNNQLTLN